MFRKLIFGATMVVLAAIMFGCKGKKAVVGRKQPAKDNYELIRGVTANELNYNNVEIKFTTRAELEGKKYSLNVTYRNKKDETLWLSVRAMMGIEAARLIANRDSVWVVSKIAQVKEKGSWNEMSKLLGYPLDFMALQNIMTRKLFYPGQAGNEMLKSFLKREDGERVLIVPDFENVKQRNDAGSFGFLPQFVIDKNYKQINSTKLVPEDNEWMLEVVYDTGSGDNLGIGNVISLSAIDSQTNISMDLKIQQISINEDFKFPFQWF